MLRFASTIVTDPRVTKALDNPRLDNAAKESLLLSIGGDRFGAQARNFIHVLVEGERVSLLPQIAEMFETLKNDAEATATATIESAMELTEAQVAELKAALEKRFGRKIETTVTVNPDLIGGARVTVGNEIAPGLVARFSRQFGEADYDEATVEYYLSRLFRIRATFSDASSLTARSRSGMCASGRPRFKPASNWPMARANWCWRK